MHITSPRRAFSTLLAAALAATLLALLPGTANAGTLTFGPTADNTVRSDQVNSVIGGVEYVAAEGASPVKYAYLKFNVAGIPAGDQVSSATLDLRSTNAVAGTLTVHATATTWTESNLTYANRPAPGAQLSAKPAVGNGLNSFPVTAAVTGNGEVAFRVAFTASTTLQLASKENLTSTFRPSLSVVTTPAADTQPPTVPTGLTGTPNAPQDPPKVDLTWTASTDNVAATGYTVKKDGLPLPDVTGTTLTDTAVTAGQGYSYTVEAFDAAGNRSAPSAPVSVTVPNPPPPPPPASIALGHWRNRTTVDAGLTWRQRMDAAETQFGPFEGHWRDYKSTNTAGTLNAAQTQALADGKRLFVNWKPCTNPGAAAAGTCDAAIITAAQDWAAKCDDNDECWITFWHEPEDDIKGGSFTVAQHKAMFTHVADLFHQNAPEVKVVWTMMGFSGHRDLYPGLWPGAQYVDIIGHDPYINGTTAPAQLATVIIDDASWLRANLPGASTKPVVAAEWGAGLSSTGGSAQHHADAIQGIIDRMPEVLSSGHVELDIFDQTDNAIHCQDLSCADAQKYKQLKTATES